MTCDLFQKKLSGAMGAIAPPWHTIFSFSVIVTKKSNRGPLKIKWTKSEDFIFGGRLAFMPNFGLQPPTVEFVPNSAKWAQYPVLRPDFPVHVMKN